MNNLELDTITESTGLRTMRKQRKVLANIVFKDASTTAGVKGKRKITKRTWAVGAALPGGHDRGFPILAPETPPPRCPGSP